MIELVEIDVRKLLRSIVADDKPATFGLVEKGFVGGEIVPVAFVSADSDTFGRAIENYFAPQIPERAIKLATVWKLAF